MVTTVKKVILTNNNGDNEDKEQYGSNDVFPRNVTTPSPIV